MATIIPQPVFTSEIKKKIAVFIASTIRPRSISFNLLHRSDDYVHRAIRELQAQGVLTYTNDHPRTVRFTPWGVERLKEEMPTAYDYYMIVSNGGHPASGEEHKLLMERQSNIQSCMMAAKIQVGAERPLLSKTVLEAGDKTPLSTSMYLPTKEMKAIKNAIAEKEGRVVKQSREQVSRASGILLSPVMDALVYDIVGNEYMRVYRSVEAGMQNQMHYLKRLLGGTYDMNDLPHRIVFYDDEQRMLSALETYRKANGNQTRKTAKTRGRKTAEQEEALQALRNSTTIYRAMTDISDWPNIAFHLLPNNVYGAWCLWIISDNTQREIYEAVARTEDGKRMGIECRNGTLYVRGKRAFEFMTCRIRRLDAARKEQKNSGSDEPVTVLCFEHQAEFVGHFFQEVPCEIMEVSLNDTTVELLI